MPYMSYGPARWVGWIMTGSVCILLGALILAFPGSFSSPNPLLGSAFFWGTVGVVAVSAGLWVGRRSHWKVRDSKEFKNG